MPTPTAAIAASAAIITMKPEWVNVTVNGKTERRQEQVRKTRWYAASGRVSRDFDDVLVMASSSLPARLGNDLTPWDLTKLEPYSPDYLAGFQAEGYTVGLADGWGTRASRDGRGDRRRRAPRHWRR